MDSYSLNAQIPYATSEELSYLTKLVQDFSSDEQIVMIGAGPGVMLMAMREGNIFSRITVVDKDTCLYAQKHLEAAELDVNVRYVVSDSAQLARLWKYGKIDLLVIDGDHSYDGVRRDLEGWLPHLAEHGYIFLHDYDANGTQFEHQEQYPGVKLAVNEALSNGFMLIARPGTAIVVQRVE